MRVLSSAVPWEGRGDWVKLFLSAGRKELSQYESPVYWPPGGRPSNQTLWFTKQCGATLVSWVEGTLDYTLNFALSFLKFVSSLFFVIYLLVVEVFILDLLNALFTTIRYFSLLCAALYAYQTLCACTVLINNNLQCSPCAMLLKIQVPRSSDRKSPCWLQSVTAALTNSSLPFNPAV